MQLSSIDANLLVVLDALLQDGSVSGAARRLALSPSATSHALGRLRELFGDPLLARAGRGLVRTRRADELAPHVRQLVQDMEQLIQGPGPFRAERLERTFQLLTTDHIEIVLLRRLQPALADAPGVTLQSRPIGSDMVDQLRSGGVDLAFCVSSDLPDDLCAEELFVERFVTLVRQDHPVRGRRLSLDRFTRLDHVLVAPRGMPGSRVDDLLASRGLERRIARTMASFLPAAHLVAESDFAVTMPSRLAQVLAPLLSLRILEPPLSLEHYAVSQIWHRRHDPDPAHAWLRQHLAQTAADLPPPASTRR